MDRDEQAIRSLITTWMQATAAADLPGVLELMDDDVVFLGAGRPPMRGRNDFAAASKAMQARVEGSADIQEVRVFGDWQGLDDWRIATRVGLAVMFSFTGVAHFTATRADLVRMVPPRLPNPALFVTLTGIAELAGAIGLLIPASAPRAAYALIVAMDGAIRLVGVVTDLRSPLFHKCWYSTPWSRQVQEVEQEIRSTGGFILFRSKPRSPVLL
jgi:uncharacterized membrane protein YphA (DoxX/SURF4 family)